MLIDFSRTFTPTPTKKYSLKKSESHDMKQSFETFLQLVIKKLDI